MRELFEKLIGGAPKFEVHAPSGVVRLYLVTCAPDLARAILEHANIDNRKIRQNKVAEYARYMRRGDWLIKSTLEFLESGRVHDGQHRLIACADAGVPLVSLLQVIPDRDAPRVNQFTDIGVPRNLADYLHFNGVYESERTSTVLVYERNYRICGNPFQQCQAERKEYLKLYEEIGGIEAIKSVYDIAPSNMHRTMGVQRAFIDWFVYQAMRIDAEQVQLFLQYVMEPENLKRTDPKLVLNQRLKDLAARRRQRKSVVSLVEQATLIVKAWNLDYEHQPASTSNLRYRVNEEWPQLKGSVA
jgi:hypothetical protein